MNTAIITGAASGIGYETAKALAKSNLKQMFLVSRREANLMRLHREIFEINKCMDIHILPFDIQNGDFVHLKKEIENKLENINILINCAGVLINKPFEKLTTADMQTMMEVNFYSPLKIVQSLVDSFVPEESHIVNIGSMGGFQGSAKFPGLVGYSASKAAIANMTESLAVELEKHKVRINCLALGAVQTDMLANAFPDYAAPQSASSVGKFIADFAINGYKYFNGKILPVSISTP
jgi:short-subunit dehydrogenase